jgi:hypothetical protein
MPKIDLPKANAAEYFGFSRQDFEDMLDLADGEEPGGYWFKAIEFVNQICRANVNELTPKQRLYAFQIKEKLDARADKARIRRRESRDWFGRHGRN